MKSIEEKYADQVKVVFHDVWTPEGKPFGEKYGIEAIPTQVFLARGYVPGIKMIQEYLKNF